MRADCAFTLIEVLISLVILSTGIVVVLQAFQTGLTAMGESRDALRASMTIREKISQAEIRAMEGVGSLESMGGSFSDDSGLYGIVGVETSLAVSRDGSNVLNRVLVQVGRQSGMTYAASTYVTTHGR